jgi:hypothetical protein
VIGSEVDDILLTWQEALRALEGSSDGQQRDELIDQVRRLETLYGRRLDAGQVSAEQGRTARTLLDETRRLLGSSGEQQRSEEPGEWY